MNYSKREKILFSTFETFSLVTDLNYQDYELMERDIEDILLYISDSAEPRFWTRDLEKTTSWYAIRYTICAISRSSSFGIFCRYIPKQKMWTEAPTHLTHMAYIMI